MFLSCTKCTIITVFSHLVGTSPLECNIFRLFFGRAQTQLLQFSSSQDQWTFQFGIRLSSTQVWRQWTIAAFLVKLRPIRISRPRSKRGFFQQLMIQSGVFIHLRLWQKARLLLNKKLFLYTWNETAYCVSSSCLNATFRRQNQYGKCDLKSRIKHFFACFTYMPWEYYAVQRGIKTIITLVIFY